MANGSSVHLSRTVIAALAMVASGISFAAVNLALQGATMRLGLSSSSATFWQYFIALLAAVPWILRRGRKAMATRHLFLHLCRILLAVAGVQLWVLSLSQVPIWQAIALLMTSPFFVIIGARLFLGEPVGGVRWFATLIGFCGGMVILAPWTVDFQFASLLPVIAAAFWAGTSLITKRLTAEEAPDTVTVYLFLLLTPVNAVLAIADGFTFPTGLALAVILAAGVFTVLANYLLTLAYSKADAAFIQPFDHLKLPLNILAGWLVFGSVPTSSFWPGAVMIVAGSLIVMRDESRREARAQKAGDAVRALQAGARAGAH